MVRPLALGWSIRIARAWAMNCRATSAVRWLVQVGGHGIERRDAGFLRIGVGHVSAQTFAAEDDAKAVFLDRLDKDLDLGNFYLAEFDGQRPAFFAGDSACAAVGDVALRRRGCRSCSGRRRPSARV